MKTFILKLTVCLLMAGCLSYPLSAQNNVQKFLRIGDTVPDFQFALKNYINPTARMSDFRGKLVILDFWAIWCGACIKAMPHMQELQKKFDGKIQIIMVTKDTEQKVKSLGSRSEIVRENKLPSAINAQRLAGLFDYRLLPTHVWVDQQGVVKFITGGSGANEQNIANFLAGKDLALKEKKDLVMSKENPLLVNWYPYQKEMLFYSYLAPTQKEYSPSIAERINEADGTIQNVTFGRAKLPELYQYAYNGLHSAVARFSNSRVFLEFRNAQKYIGNDTLSFNEDGAMPTFMYELRNGNNIPKEKVLEHMRMELDLAFGVKSKMEKRRIKCYVMKRNVINDSILSKNKSGGSYYKYDSGRLITLNIPWKNFFDMQLRDAPLQLIDETKVSSDEKVDITISKYWINLQEINRTLEKYGLVVTEEERELDCIVLRDN